MAHTAPWWFEVGGAPVRARRHEAEWLAERVREEIRRPDFGHLEIKVTVDDPKAYTKPWTVTLTQRIVVDAELIDEICLENEQFVQRMKLPD